MIISIRVVPKASRNLVKKEADGLKVYVSSCARDGLANARVVELLSEYLKIKKYQLKIIKGHTSRNKLVEINA